MKELNSFEKIAAIHQSVSRGFFVVTGGGSGVLSALLQVPGASRTMIEAVVPYSSEAMSDFLHQRPEQFCSEPTARRIAAMAWQKARKLLKNDVKNTEEVSCEDSIFGFALTATLATSREHRGSHRAFAAFQSGRRTVSYALEFEKGRFDRAEEETLTTDWALDRIAEFCGVQPASQTPVKLLDAPESWRRVLNGSVPFIEIHRDGSCQETLSPEIRGIFPGSFAPIHAGHCAMHACAERMLGGPVALELAVLNADKPPLDFVAIKERLRQIFSEPAFSGKAVLLSGLPFFESKAEFFPARTFLVGIDTLERIADAKYHFFEPILLEKSLRRLAELRARFLVFGRCKETADGRYFEDFQPQNFPATLSDLCTGVPESVFRSDLSSTEIRARSADSR